MSLFIEKSVIEIVTDIKNGRLTLDEVYSEVCEKTAKYGKYKVWACFSNEVLSRNYKNLPEINNEQKESEFSIYGIPVGIKDIVNTIDYPTQMGSIIWKNFEAGNDARIVYNIQKHGGVVAGKTITAEFAVHALNETLNPYDIDRTPGTSSSGSAVAVALGVVPIAIATQTAGSIIRPSSFCGAFGYVPSFGLIPRTGVLKTTDSLDTIGFIASRIDNIRVFLDVISVKGPDYPFVYKYFSDVNRQTRGNRKWKVCFSKTYIWDEAEEYVKLAVQSFVDTLKKDDEIVVHEENTDSIISGAHDIHSTIYDKSLSYYFENEHRDNVHVSNIMNEMIVQGKKISGEDFQNALNKQDTMYRKMDDFMSQYDVMITVSTSSIAPKRGEIEKKDPSLIWTLLHMPAISIPQFIEKESGLPFGVQVTGRRYNDGLLLEFVEYLVKKGLVSNAIREPLSDW